MTVPGPRDMPYERSDSVSDLGRASARTTARSDVVGWACHNSVAKHAVKKGPKIEATSPHEFGMFGATPLSGEFVKMERRKQDCLQASEHTQTDRPCRTQPLPRLTRDERPRAWPR